MKVVVAPIDEFPPGSRRIVTVGKREIGVFRVAERFYAVRNRCPHQGAALCQGRLMPRLVSDEPGVVTQGDGPPVVVCPWHGWQFDAHTGEAFAPGDPRVRRFDVSVEPGTDLAAVVTFAEAFPVHVEGDYVVLET
jgi:nitrite reductase/ring-hydroxylating ferredoxin subunit